MDLQNKTVKEMIDTAATKIEENLNWDGHLSDLHNFLCNEDYYTVGTHEAVEELEAYGTFKAIEKIKTYEQDNFGDVSCDFSDPEKCIGMLYYIIGEELLAKCPAALHR